MTRSGIGALRGIFRQLAQRKGPMHQKASMILFLSGKLKLRRVILQAHPRTPRMDARVLDDLTPTTHTPLYPPSK